MSLVRPITFAVAVNNREVLQNNFLCSACLDSSNPIQILQQENFSSAAAAYNHAIEVSKNDLIVFCHQDMFFPADWLADLNHAIDYLDGEDPNWGVVGCWGVTAEKKGFGHVYTPGIGVIGRVLDHPEPIQTLDEIVLVMRKSSGLRFDETLSGFHMYGSDICLTAAKAGKKNYAISAYCVHNSRQGYALPSAFYKSCEQFREKWWNSLPVQTACIEISKSNRAIYERKIREVLLKYVFRKKDQVFRPETIKELLAHIESTESVQLGS